MKRSRALAGNTFFFLLLLLAQCIIIPRKSLLPGLANAIPLYGSVAVKFIYRLWHVNRSREVGKGQDGWGFL